MNIAYSTSKVMYAHHVVARSFFISDAVCLC